MLYEENIDILCVCETWLDSSIDDKFIHIPNFKVVRCDAGRGSGVCIYVRESLDFSVINSNVEKFEGIEDVWLQVQLKKVSFIYYWMHLSPP